MTKHYVLTHNEAGKQSAKVLQTVAYWKAEGYDVEVLTLDEYAALVKGVQESRLIKEDLYAARVIQGRGGGKSAFGTIGHNRIGDFFVEPKSPFEKQKRSKGEKKRNRSEWRNNMKGHLK